MSSSNFNELCSKRKDYSYRRLRKVVCTHGELCSRLSEAHLREYSHPHLEVILDNHTGPGEYLIPERLALQRAMILDQINIIVEKQLYEPKNRREDDDNTMGSSSNEPITKQNDHQIKYEMQTSQSKNNMKLDETRPAGGQNKGVDLENLKIANRWEKMKSEQKEKKLSETVENYKPIVPPTRSINEYFNVVRPTGQMASKHEASAPYYIFYNTITKSKETHGQPYSITFQEILDRSLGELQCSLQITFLVNLEWLLGHYHFAGYSEKNLTILYGKGGGDIGNKPNIQAHKVIIDAPLGLHHTKMMILCYEDGSLRVVVSTANLYLEDWENRTQGLWFSPRCPELPAGSMPDAGESPTMFKRSLLRYLHEYRLPDVTVYVDRVKRCDFSHINVFLVSSIPGLHADQEWGMNRMGSLLQQHCCIPPEDNWGWPLLAQASSLGSYGQGPKLWLTGEFLANFSKIKNQSQELPNEPDVKVIFPSLENVKQSHEGILGGGGLSYFIEVNSKQRWIKDFLYQWRASSSARDKAMPHIKSYVRVSPDHKLAAYYLLTSGNASKSAWGWITEAGGLNLVSYESGVLLVPQFVINQDFFPLEGADRLVLPYDVPLTKYEPHMTPWLKDYLRWYRDPRRAT